jgi:hypothetical protein
MHPWAGLVCGTTWWRKQPVPVIRCVMIVWCLVNIWGCAHPVVHPDTQERSAIAFARQVMEEMSTGLDKLRACLGATVTDKGEYRIFVGDLFPHDVTKADLMQNFARLCTHIGGIMSQSVCTSSAADDKQVKFVVHAEDQPIKAYAKIRVTVYEPVGTPSAEFLQAIRPYR